MSNINPITTNITNLRGGITSVTTPGAPTHEYARPPLVPSEPGPIARTLDEFIKPPVNDPGELLKHRFLCRGAGLLLVGQTGLGKSSLAMQLMIKWALGQSVFGLEPTHKLKSLLIQAENDDGDLAEMKCGVFNGLTLSEEEQAEASNNVLVTKESSKTGTILCQSVIEPLLREIKPDLLWIDPALAYIGGDMNSQKDVGQFLRNDLAPLLAKYNCAAIIIHHTNKISKDPEKQMTDVSYLGAGSAEWINWCRAMLALRKTDVDNLYELIAAKRGSRLKWKSADGENLTFTKYIGHSRRPDTICWNEMAIADAEELRANNGKQAEDVLKHVPQEDLIAKDQLIEACQIQGIGKHLAQKLIAELLTAEKLHEYQVPRKGVKAKVLLGREKLSLSPSLYLDAYRQNSHGYYITPAPEPAKSTL
jgi:RecA-family ATPase